VKEGVREQRVQREKVGEKKSDNVKGKECVKKGVREQRVLERVRKMDRVCD